MYIIKSNKNLDYICLCVTEMIKGDTRNDDNDYEYSSCDLDCVTKFKYKEDARFFIEKFELVADYKIVKIK